MAGDPGHRGAGLSVRHATRAALRRALDLSQRGSEPGGRARGDRAAWDSAGCPPLVGRASRRARALGALGASAQRAEWLRRPRSVARRGPAGAPVTADPPWPPPPAPPPPPPPTPTPRPPEGAQAPARTAAGPPAPRARRAPSSSCAVAPRAPPPTRATRACLASPVPATSRRDLDG